MKIEIAQTAFKLALRNLKRHRNRTRITILSVILGVSIITGVGIATDSIIKSLENNVSQRLGSTDILFKPNNKEATFEFNATVEDILSSVDGVKQYVTRVSEKQTIFINKTQVAPTSAIVSGINVSDPIERNFGTVRIIETFPEYSDFVLLEDFLGLPGKPCVISELLSLMGNLTIGDYIRIRATDQDALGQHWDIPGTWTLFRVVAIIEDQGEVFQQFDSSVEDSFGLTHPGVAIYCSLNLTRSYIFNAEEQQGQVQYIMIQNEFGHDISQTIANLYEAFNNSPEFSDVEWYGLDLQQSYLLYYLKLISLFKALFYAIGIITLVLCSLLVKNIFDIAVEETQFEIGVLRAIGGEKPLIRRIFIIQVEIIAFVGTLIGIIAGIAISDIILRFILESDTLLSQWQNKTLDLQYSIYISSSSVLIPILCGFFIPMLFGLIPARHAAKINVIQALKSNVYTRNPRSQIHAFRIIISLIIGSVLIVLGDYLSSTGISAIFIMEEYPELNTSIATVIGILFILMGFLTVGFIIYPLLTKALTAILSPLLQEMTKITYRNILRNRKRTRNTFAILSIGLCLLITLGTITTSFYDGGEITSQIMSAGDIKVSGVPFPYERSDLIENITGVETACHYIDGIPYAQIDGFGGGNKSLSRAEFVSLTAVDAGDYALAVKSIIDQSIQFAQKQDWNTILSLFKSGGYVILDSVAKDVLHKNIGDQVHIDYSIGASEEYTILAFIDDLPGFPGFLFSNDLPTDPRIGIHALISWDDYVRSIETAFGNADIVIENPYIDPTGQKPLEHWGDQLDWFNYSLVNQILSGVPKIATDAPRIMIPAMEKYWIGFQAQYLPETLHYTLLNEDYLTSTFNRSWVDTFKHLTVIDPEKDHIIGTAPLLEVNSSAIQAGMGSSIEDLLQYYDNNHPSVRAVVVGKYWKYVNSSNWQMTLNQHYVGETLVISGKNYTVVGVLDCAETFWGDNYITQDLGQSEGFYVDAYSYPSARFRSSDMLYFSFQTATRDLFNETTKPSIFYTNSQPYNHGDITALFLDLEDGADVEDTIETIQAQFNAIPALENLSLFNIDHVLNRSGLFHVSYFLQLSDGTDLDLVVDELKNVYYSQGLMLTDSGIATTEKYMEEGYAMLKLVLSILTFLLGFSFLVAIFGQIISVLISIQHRSKEIGTFRAFGTSSSQVKKLIMAESVILGLIGLIIGLGSGLFTSFALLFDIPFNPVIGFIFVLPVKFILITAGILFTVIILSGIIPVTKIININIVDAIRKRD